MEFLSHCTPPTKRNDSCISSASLLQMCVISEMYASLISKSDLDQLSVMELSH